ncbi:hypothetical protein BN1708_016948, partial [Verticillium longisporum]
MAGVLVELRVKEGSDVKKGDPIAVLSAMKMEMVISAPHNGQVSSLQVKEGDSVDGSDLVCKIVKANDDNPALAWTSTTVEQEELWARLRYERMIEAERQTAVMSLDGTAVQSQSSDGRWLATNISQNVEPYMMSGYEELMRRENERQAPKPKDVYSPYGSSVGGY